MLTETIRATIQTIATNLTELDGHLGLARRELPDIVAAEGLVALLKLKTTAEKNLRLLLAAARDAGNPGLFDDKGPDSPKGGKRK